MKKPLNIKIDYFDGGYGAHIKKKRDNMNKLRMDCSIEMEFEGTESEFAQWVHTVLEKEADKEVKITYVVKRGLFTTTMGQLR